MVVLCGTYLYVPFMVTVYKKRHPTNPVSLSTGKHIVFEDLGQGYGFYQTDNPSVIAEFATLMSEHRGGVELSSPQEYADELKKKSNSLTSSGSQMFGMQTSGLIVPELANPAAFVAAGPDSNRLTTVRVSEPQRAAAASHTPFDITPPVVQEIPTPRVAKRKV